MIIQSEIFIIFLIFHPNLVRVPECSPCVIGNNITQTSEETALQRGDTIASNICCATHVKGDKR